MKKLEIRYLMFAAAVFAASHLSGCASLGRPVTEIEAKLVEASDALDFVNVKAAAFYQDYGTLAGEIKNFFGRPGWLEFEQVLIENPGLMDPEGRIEITPEIESRLSNWGARWNASWEETLVGYHDLVDKCTILEAKRLAVRERLIALQAKYLGAVMLALSAGRDQQAKEIYSLVELLDKTGAELNSYRTDDLGLYR